MQQCRATTHRPSLPDLALHRRNRPHAAALAADDGAALHAASVKLEQMGALLLAADAAAQAATVHAPHNRRGFAHAAATRAHQLAQACEGARTPALAALTAPLPLTHREREIVTLAAGGLSNREIAQRLVVSVHTVETTSTAPAPNSAPPTAPKLAALLRGHQHPLRTHQPPTE
jgi:ATP/maltotriose-dependent transcriptional regulator MalT